MPEVLASTFAHPLWLVERWCREYGLSFAHQICRYNQQIPATAIRLRTPVAPEHLEEEELGKEGITLAPGRLLAPARCVQAGEVTKTQTFLSGKIVIQDEASQLVASLMGSLASQEKLRILDCCAAPGMKTLAMSDENPSATIVAVELHPHRARLLQNLVHAHESRVQIVVADAQHLPFSFPFDSVLADVPCSGTGTLARNPEIKWRLKVEDLADLHARQVAILRSAMAQVASGGCLVYSTCSLEKEENEDVIEQVLFGDNRSGIKRSVDNRSDNSFSEGNSFRLRDCRAALDQLKNSGELTWPDPTSLTRGLYLRTVPGVHPCDGFFAAILERI